MSDGLPVDQVPNGAVFLNLALRNRFNQIIVDRFSEAGISDWWLTAGCLAQSVWNVGANRPAEQAIADYDLFYFDPDTSWAAEDTTIKAVGDMFSELSIRVEIRNQARVPIWYPEKFGVEYGAVTGASDGIDRFAYRTTAIGLRKIGDGYRLYAPFGLDAVLDGEIIPNPVLPVRAVYEAKVARWQKIWPDLTVMPWPDNFDNLD